MTNTADDNVDSFSQQVEGEFLDEVRDVVNGLDVLLENVRSRMVPPADALLAIQRHVQSLRMLGRSVNFPLINVATLRMEDYIGSLETLDGPAVTDVQAFSDKVRGILDGDILEDKDVPVAAAAMVRELPVKKSPLPEVDFHITLNNIEVMLIIPERAMSRIVERELHACGYRVTNVRSAFEGFEMAIRTKPDMIIASLTLSGLNGVEMARALAAIPRTEKIPFGLLTSFSWGHPDLEGLPARAALLRKGPGFGDDLAQALERFNIT